MECEEIRGKGKRRWREADGSGEKDGDKKAVME